MTHPAHPGRASGRPPLLTAALEAAELGWPVLPLRPGDKRPAGHSEARCPGTGRCSRGHLTPEQRATLDPDLIRRCWAQQPYNVGIATGRAGLVVIDLDMPKTKSIKGMEDTPSGVTTFTALCERAGHPVPHTYRVRTASGGEHLYFTAPPGAVLRNTASKLGPLIDTRAHGGYVVAPGSIVPVGAYAVAEAAPVLQLPSWLHNVLTVRQEPSRALPTLPPRRNRTGYATAALRGETRNVAEAPPGTRNATLLRAARALGRLVASGDLTRDEVEQALSGAAADVGNEPQHRYDDVITRALNWSVTHNTTGTGNAA